MTDRTIAALYVEMRLQGSRACGIMNLLQKKNPSLSGRREYQPRKVIFMAPHILAYQYIDRNHCAPLIQGALPLPAAPYRMITMRLFSALPENTQNDYRKFHVYTTK